MKIRNSDVKSFNRCKREYHYKFIQGLVPNSGSLPLKRGDWLHQMLESHYRDGDWRPRWKELKKDFDRLFDEEKDRYGDLPAITRHIMQSYQHRYWREDEDLEIIAVEEVVEVPLPHGHTYQFKFDMVAEDEWGRWLWEHKSHRTIPSAEFRFIDMQTAKYVWALNKTKQYGDIIGICWNYLVTKPPTVPKLKKDGTLSKRKIKTDLYTFVRALRNYGLDPGDYRDDIIRLKGTESPFFRRERVPVTERVTETLMKETVWAADQIERGFPAVRSIDRSCSWCSYLEPCMTALYGGDEDLVLKAKFHKGDDEDYYGYKDEEVEEVISDL